MGQAEFGLVREAMFLLFSYFKNEMMLGYFFNGPNYILGFSFMMKFFQ